MRVRAILHSLVVAESGRFYTCCGLLFPVGHKVGMVLQRLWIENRLAQFFFLGSEIA